MGGAVTIVGWWSPDYWWGLSVRRWREEIGDGDGVLVNRHRVLGVAALLRKVRRFLAGVVLCGGFFALAQPAFGAPWLFVSDIHFNPRAISPVPASYGLDTNLALLKSSIAEMKRVDPAAPVIVITGDFLAHGFDYARAEPTMSFLAQRFDAAFPKAQFVIALGNEDSGCGDYELTAKEPFLHTTAVAWEPLVNRHGAAPAFARTFSREGFYTATLPLPHLEAVVIDDVSWSPRYRAGCGGTSPADQTMADLRAALHEQPGDRKWVIAHIPPGVDAFSTVHLVHHLVVVPFLNPSPRRDLATLVNDPRSHVMEVLSAHAHKFAYRVDGETHASPVAFLLIPSISPIFRNAPSFLTADVSPSGTIRDADDHAFLGGRWQTIGGTRTLGLSAVTGGELLALQTRLARDPKLRERYAVLYSAGGPPEIDERNWRAYWCATTALGSTAYSACLGGNRGIGPVTRRGVSVIVIGAIVVAVLLAGTFVFWRSRRAESAES